MSGQIPADAAGTLVEGSIADKTKVCCEGLKNILQDAGSGIERVVKVSGPARKPPFEIPCFDRCTVADYRPASQSFG